MFLAKGNKTLKIVIEALMLLLVNRTNKTISDYHCKSV